MNDGKPFENEVAAIYEILTALDPKTKVVRNRMEQGPDGVRQLDVVLETVIAGEEYLTVIECKDHKRKTSITDLDAFHSKISDLKASKGILVSRRGFSGKAIKKANRLGVSLCTLDLLAEKLENPLSSVPVICRNVIPENFVFNFLPNPASLAKLKSMKLKMDLEHPVSGVSVWDLMKLIEPRRLIKDGVISVDIHCSQVPFPLWQEFESGERLELEKFTMSFKSSGKVYAGYLSEFPSSREFARLSSGNTEVFFDHRDLDDPKSFLREYSCYEDLPDNFRGVRLVFVNLPPNSTSFAVLSQSAYAGVVDPSSLL